MLSKLINKRFNCITRAIDMLCLQLGEEAEFSLHLQTPWRFVKEGEILLASRDIYEPYDENVPNDWKFDIPDRPDEISSIFDVGSKKLDDLMKDSYVVESSLSKTKDITVAFSNGVVFEAFIVSSVKDEKWRFIDGEIHTVCYEDGEITVD